MTIYFEYYTLLFIIYKNNNFETKNLIIRTTRLRCNISKTIIISVYIKEIMSLNFVVLR